MNDVSRTYDVAVVGGGPVGLATAVALAQAGINTVLVARHAPYADNRTTALLGGSADFLASLDVWQSCVDKVAPLATMRLVDDTGRLIRAPEVRFDAAEIGIEAFGYNIENRVLVEALEQRAAALPHLVRIADDAQTVRPTDDVVTISTAGGESVTSPLVIGADGRHSLCREAAGIAVSSRALKQTALTFNISHARPHRNISTEFHTPHGPCVFVPLPGNRSSIVWVMAPKDAERLAALDDAALSAATEKQSHSILGRVTVEPGRHMFPLAIERPHALARQRVVLAGEAAHVVPPIGAQGLNLGLRDAMDIAGIVGKAKESGEDLGAAAVLARYGSARRSDILGRTFVIDIANRSLLSELLPVQSMRAAGLHLIGSIGPLRRLAMRQGIGQGAGRRAS